MPLNIATERQSTLPTRSGRTPSARHHILLAEDDAEMRAMLTWALSHEGYDVIECRNGEELSLCIREACVRNSESVDLIISDIRMPGLSGLGVLKIHGPKPRCPPIILMTAFGDYATRHEAERMGAVAFFDKPFGLDDLIHKVREIVPR